ncbi:MAG: ParB/RepB/Spo0J family partition protein [Eubacteriaceae bacterium]|nr:ParB/RepB/Spo0J family partition protein [Eubacteriaceae bacterium]
MAAKKKNTGLGKGLEALFGDAESVHDTDDKDQGRNISEGPEEISIDDIKPNVNQPRKSFDPETLEDLADSIAEHGVIQPIIVRNSGNGYEIVAGERRWRAARQAGLKKIPCLVRELSEEELALFAIIENMQREDLNPVEEAEGLERMISAFGLTQEQVSKSVGKSRPYISNSLRLLKLPDEIRQLLSEGKLSNGHGRALLGLENMNKQIILANRIVKEGLSVRTVEQIVSGGDKKPKAKPRQITKSADVMQVEEDLKHVLGTRVNLKQSGKKGRIEIEYYSREELERLIEILRSL